MMPICDIIKRIPRLGWRDYEPAGFFFDYSVLRLPAEGNSLRPNFLFPVRLAQELQPLAWMEKARIAPEPR
jgi:hypothetical protein